MRGEPIVNTPEDAYRCFMRTDMDILVLESFLLFKEEQPPSQEKMGHLEDHKDLGVEPICTPIMEALSDVWTLPIRFVANHAIG